MVQQFGQERYEFILNETQTHQVIKDVRNRFSDLVMLFSTVSLLNSSSAKLEDS